MMQPFVFHTPTRIVFGDDTASSIGELLADLGMRNPLVVTDDNLIRAGLLKTILAGLESSGFSKPAVFDEVPPDSDLVSVRKAAQLAIDARCDSVIAVGGGSVIDTGKVANIGLSCGGDVLDFEGMNTLSSRLLPMLAVPTTAGTGSEVSAVAMVKNQEERKKLMFASRYLFPDIAILDPRLLLSLPPKLTAATGIDALTHAIESYVATTSNPAADGLCLEAMRLLFINLPRATVNGADLEARSGTLAASMMAGVAFSNAGVGIVHALAHSVGARYGTHHGLTNAIFLQYGMEFNLDSVAEKFGRAYAYLSQTLPASDLSKKQTIQQAAIDLDVSRSAKMLIEAVRSLISSLGLPRCLKDAGIGTISKQDLQELAETAVNDPAILFNPKPASIDELIEIIKRAY